ncbi:MAG: choice-of-anchor Q domain-containing protein [Kofleriaceae bacterium]
MEFNTIVDNHAPVMSGGVICDVGSFQARNNIIARNTVGGTRTAQVTGSCGFASSKIQDDVDGLEFIDSASPAPFDYRVGAGSTAIDQATATSEIDIDFEGDGRPQGPGKDLGADEWTP